MNRRQTFGASPVTDFLGNILGGATSNLQSQLTSSLPSQQTVAEVYLTATVAFWLIGGVTLYLVFRTGRK